MAYSCNKASKKINQIKAIKKIQANTTEDKLPIMIKRTLFFGNPAVLRLKDKQLSIDTKTDTGSRNILVPVEDIGMIVIDDPQITLSSGLLQALQEKSLSFS